MIKDFIPVGQGEAEADDIRFVETYWTEKLSGDVERAVSADLGSRDEYRVMSAYLDQRPRGAPVLDGGCGAGEWTVFFHKLGYDVTGLDISQELIARLGRLFPDCSWMRGDLRSTGLPEASVDILFSWGAFEHFEVGLGPCLTEARRLLKPGGLLFFSVPFANGRVRRIRGGSDVSGSAPPGKRFYQWRCTEDDLRADLGAAGFEVLKIVPIHKLDGLRRMLNHDFGISLAAVPRLEHALLRCLRPFVPTAYVAHMIMAAGRKSG